MLFTLGIRERGKNTIRQSQSCSNFNLSSLTRIAGEKNIHGDGGAAPVATSLSKGNEKTAMGAKSTSAFAQCVHSEHTQGPSL